MYKPTAKEQFVLKNALGDMQTDLEILSNAESLALALKLVPYKDLLGTLGTNIEVIRNIHRRLLDEPEP